MASIVVAGDTSGSITLAAPAVAGTNTITLPTNTGTMITTASSGAVTQSMLATLVTPLGVGQTVQNVTSSRAFATTYTNSTGRPIFIWVQGLSAGVSGNKAVSLIIDTVLIISNGFFTSTGNNYPLVSGIIPNGATYSVSADGVSLDRWVELR